MGTERSSMERNSSYGDAPETPSGIWVIAVVGIIGALFSMFLGVSGVFAGKIPTVTGVVLVVVAVAQGVTMLALVGLTPWAWYGTILLYVLSAGINLRQGEGIAMVVSLVVVAYVGVHRDLFEQ